MSSHFVLPSGSSILILRTAPTILQGEKSDPQPIRGVERVAAPGAAPARTEEPASGTQTPAGPTGTKPQSSTDACMSTLPLIVGMFALMYFLVIRPQQKTEKARRAMLAAVKKGDRVVTSGGIHGEVTALDDTSVTLKCAGGDGVHLRVDRSAVGRVLGLDGEAAQGAPANGKAGGDKP